MSTSEHLRKSSPSDLSRGARLLFLTQEISKSIGGLRKVKCYVAGPMRGIENFNYPAFDSAAYELRCAGWRVYNPAETDDLVREEATASDTPLRVYLRGDLPQVVQSDVVFVLPGWADSEGASLEAEVARRLGIPVYDFTTLFEFEFVPRVIEGDGLERLSTTTPTRHPGSQRFHELLEQAGTLHDLKQGDYGQDNDPFANVRSSLEWGLDPWLGAMVRLNDKVKRLQKLATKGSLVNESAKDSFMDIAVYALIAYVLYEEQYEPQS